MSFHVRRFNRSAPHYESVAGIQRGMADRLVDLWEGPDPAKILELGCGTGLLTRRLLERFPGASILATDAASNMLDEARKSCGESPRLKFAEQNAAGAAEVSGVAASHAPFDGIVSNALVQWFPDLEQHLRFAAGLTRPGGSYLLSGFTRSNFPELNALLSEPPFSYRVFPGHDLEEIAGASANAGWKSVAVQTWDEVEILPSAMEVLHRIQILGSTRDPREGGRLNRRSLRHLLSEYERRFSDSKGVKLTWKPWIGLFNAV